MGAQENDVDVAAKLLGTLPQKAPDIAEVRQFLQDRRGVKLPLLAYPFSKLTRDAEDLAEHIDCDMAITFGHLVFPVLLKGSDSYAAFFCTSYIDTVFKLLFTHSSAPFDNMISMDRNVQQGGDWSAALPVRDDMRPNFIAAVDMRPIAVGEEKDQSLLAAIQDLRKKCCGLNPAHYGDVEYTLAYAATGDLIQFFAVTRAGGLQAVSKALPSDTPWQRLILIHYAINLYRLLQCMARQLPDFMYRRLNMAEGTWHPCTCGQYIIKRKGWPQRVTFTKHLSRNDLSDHLDQFGSTLDDFFAACLLGRTWNGLVACRTIDDKLRDTIIVKMDGLFASTADQLSSDEREVVTIARGACQGLEVLHPRFVHQM
ncbi:hypothetical protein WJX73_002986 [Symbiochloris irregularis]|uniref:Uncharacterized protein n=1 Tax=Symbiochloris irregularis TaxID=706552 RepID=A0AAW1NQM0_9CHLO